MTFVPAHGGPYGIAVGLRSLTFVENRRKCFFVGDSRPTQPRQPAAPEPAISPRPDSSQPPSGVAIRPHSSTRYVMHTICRRLRLFSRVCLGVACAAALWCGWNIA